MTTADGYPQMVNAFTQDRFKGFLIKLSDLNPFASESGAFTWVCDPIP